jgi:hypothetical protein
MTPMRDLGRRDLHRTGRAPDGQGRSIMGGFGDP